VETPAERDRYLETLLPTHRADGVLAISLPLSPRAARAVGADADRERGWGVSR
jgi:hypothetical protein